MSMAWRNIWRNKRRTLVILAAVFIGVSSMLFLAAVSRGMVYSMVENSIGNFTGHLLIRNTDFVSDPSVDNIMYGADTLTKTIKEQIPAVSKVVKRIRLGAMLNTARNSEGVTLVGTDIAAEKGVSFIGDAFIEGETPSGSGALIGRALSDKIGLGIDKKIIINMQGADGEIASRAFRIKGIFSAQENLEKTFVFVQMDMAEAMLGTEDAATEISVILPGSSLESTVYSVTSEQLKKVVDENKSVMSWREVLPALSSYLDLFDDFMFIWYVIVFIAMGFGIVNTVLMAVYERVREFGLIRALGVRWTGIFRMVMAETSLILLTGLAAGNLMAILLIWYFSYSGLDLTQFAKGADMFGVSRIVYPVFSIGDMIKADLTVFVLGVLVSLYPAYKACSFTPVETMRDV